MKEIQPGLRTAPVREVSAAARPSLGRILVVEDEPDVAKLIRYNLVRAGYEVAHASNGADALRLALEARPDLMLLDLMIPGSTAGRSAGGSARTRRPAPFP
jgi:DNA-binding response OmpR family regulator